MEQVRWGDENAKDPLAGLQNTEAEQALLGALMIDNRAFEHVADIVRAEDFGFAVHGRIFGAISQMMSAGIVANPVTMKNSFTDDGALASVGGPKYLVDLARSAVSIINARSYAESISDLARRREVVAAAQDMIADAAIIDIDRSSETVIDEAEQRLFEIAERKTHGAGPQRIGEVMVKTIASIEAAYKAGGAITVDTGLIDLDRIIAGMGAGDLCVLAGRPAMGKSAMMGSIAFNVASRPSPVLIFSLEMTREELSQRWIAGLTNISTDQQRHGQVGPDDWHRIVGAQRTLETMPIYIDDQARLSVAQMRQRARRMRRRHGLGLIIIDHLQLVRQGGKQESRRLEIGDATSALKAIAKEIGVPILLLSQLSRACEMRENKRPILSDLRESGDIEQDADVVMFIYRDEYYLSRAEPKRRAGQTGDSFAADQADWEDRCQAARGLAEIEVAKNRHGRTGLAKVLFEGSRQRFENLARGF